MSVFIRMGELHWSRVASRPSPPPTRASASRRCGRTPGNVDCDLLAPVAEGDPVIACTVWQSEAAARDYEASGTARDVVARVKSFFAAPPKLRSYTKG